MGVSSNKAVGLRLQRGSQPHETPTQVFPVNFAEFLRTTFSQNTSGRLLLIIYKAAVGADI